MYDGVSHPIVHTVWGVHVVVPQKRELTNDEDCCITYEVRSCDNSPRGCYLSFELLLHDPTRAFGLRNRAALCGVRVLQIIDGNKTEYIYNAECRDLNPPLRRCDSVRALLIQSSTDLQGGAPAPRAYQFKWVGWWVRIKSRPWTCGNKVCT